MELDLYFYCLYRSESLATKIAPRACRQCVPLSITIGINAIHLRKIWLIETKNKKNKTLRDSLLQIILNKNFRYEVR